MTSEAGRKLRDPVVVSRPLSVRILLAGMSALIGSFGTLLLANGTNSRLLFLCGLACTTVLTIRGWRVSLAADRSTIRVRNHFRTYELQWERVSRIGISVTTLLSGSFAAVGFSEREGRQLIAAQATTSSGKEQTRVVRELAALRPDLDIQYTE